MKATDHSDPGKENDPGPPGRDSTQPPMLATIIACTGVLLVAQGMSLPKKTGPKRWAIRPGTVGELGTPLRTVRVCRG